MTQQNSKNGFTRTKFSRRNNNVAPDVKIGVGERKLTIKQRKFADEFLRTGNAARSYINAGYSCGRKENANSNASVYAHALIRNPKIVEYVEEVNGKITNERIADIIEVKAFWTTVLRDPEAKMPDRLKASEFIAKTNAAFIDRVEHSGGVKVEHEHSLVQDIIAEHPDLAKQVRDILRSRLGTN